MSYFKCPNCCKKIENPEHLSDEGTEECPNCGYLLHPSVYLKSYEKDWNAEIIKDWDKRGRPICNFYDKQFKIIKQLEQTKEEIYNLIIEHEKCVNIAIIERLNDYANSIQSIIDKIDENN